MCQKIRCFKISDIIDKMDLRTNDKNERTAKRVAAILKMNGYVNPVRRDKETGKTVRVWEKKA